ncbi:N-acetyltransferase [Paenibacillus sp. R14(2021)]|uniref:GNAT family N-acetyltransferase n=1 Tax=Paenibacillus sp. R14(2021) TaxID=2859228 RepID=UPI001C6150DA|nr:GNAT family N-acetyltransferase [Paenibacillus sp. R14(2021)]
MDSHRRAGAGQLLLDAVKKFGQLTSAKGIALSTARDNLQAQRLYERNGYCLDEEFQSYFLKL